VVNDVIPQGNRSVPPQKILGLIRTKPGTEFNPDTVAEDVRKLYETKLFGNIQVKTDYTSDGKINVYFLVVEYPGVIQEIVYQGAKHLKASDLDSLTGLRKGMPMNPIANQMACQAIVRRYNEQGRPFAHCGLVEGGNPTDTRVVFDISEGPIAKVSDVRFVGNTFVSGARLATQVNSSKEWFGLFGGTYNPVMADLDEVKLEEYYKSNGYQDVKVRRELQWDADQRHVVLVFHVQEGPRYKVEEAVVSGNKDLPAAQVNALPKVKHGEFYNKAKVDADMAAIRDYYGYTGRDVSVRERLVYPEPGLCLVKYEIEERRPARVGEIFVVGNEVTRQNVILRQVPLYPGQVLTFPDLRVAERNLARLNIFEVNPETGVRPTVTVIDPDGDSEFKNILVQVQETRTGAILLGLGVNSDAGLQGSLVVNERNFDITRFPTSLDDALSGRAFRGAGQELRLEAVPGTQLQRYSATFREPFLFDSPYSLTAGGYYFTRRYDEYDETRLGTRLTLGRKFNQYWSASATLRVEDVDVKNVPLGAPASIADFQGNNFLVGLRGGVQRDTRDSYLRPTEGSLLDLSYEQCFGDFTFPLVNVEYNQYFTVYQRPDGSGRHVVSLRSQFGWANNNTPVFERFYAGGFRSLRGFQFRGVGPFEKGLNPGGDFMWLNSFEYQMPVLANDQAFVVAFVDSGTVEEKVEITTYRVTAGFGFRFVVPMLGPVPIALDFGFPIVKGPQDKEQIFSFWLGFFH
ncbi:MAG TPA: outer membrane protein assembly factor BamA, partial [Gemmataceae bacterium]|nr:outer membrane protein assembly factor BamA [Gemmataceae bacterium]